MQLLRVVAEALLQAASAGHNAESSSGTESESEPSRPPTAVTPRPRLESSLQATRSAPPLSISPSQVGTERGTASTMTIKETLFDIDGGCPPHTVTSQSDAVDPSRPLPATAAFYADDADGTQAIPNCGAMPPYEQSFAENAGTVQAASAPSDEVENAEEDAETRASHMSDCIWWLDASHPISRFFEVASMIVILVSIFTFVLETIPRYRLEPNGEERSDTHPDFVALEIFCIGWFTVEYLMRMYAAKGWRLKWARQPLNVIDLLAIVPYYVSLGLSNGAVGSAFVIVRILRLMRVTRLFKFSRHSQALRVRRDWSVEEEGDMIALSRNAKKPGVGLGRANLSSIHLPVIICGPFSGHDLLHHANSGRAASLLFHHQCRVSPLWLGRILL